MIVYWGLHWGPLFGETNKCSEFQISSGWSAGLGGKLICSSSGAPWPSRDRMPLKP